jgi:large subunit ribosomal protein L24
MMWIKTDDTVEILAGDDRGTRGKVLRVIRENGKAVIEGVNRVYKHVKRSQRNPQGGRLSREMPVQLSNVALVCEACGAATRTGARTLDDGSKERYCKKCGASNGQISPAKSVRTGK